jgi:hypothetical protein
MRTLITLMLVLGVMAFMLPAGAQARIWLPLNNINAVCDNAIVVSSSENMVYLECEDGSAYIVFFGISDNQELSTPPASDVRFLAGGNFISMPDWNPQTLPAPLPHLWPEPSTIVFLGLAGLLLHRRRGDWIIGLPLRISRRF